MAGLLSKRTDARHQEPPFRAVVERSYRFAGQPAGNPKATYRVADVDEPDPEFWLESAEKHTDSWWPDFVAWFAERSGKKHAAPESSVAPAWRRWSPLLAATCSSD